METLTAHGRADIGLKSSGIGKHFEMHPSRPSTSSCPSSATNPASRMLPPKTAIHDDKNKDKNHSQTTTRSSFSQDSPGTQSSFLSANSEITRASSPPSTSQLSSQDADASQSNDRLHTPEQKQQQGSSQEANTTPGRHKRSASGLLKAVDSPADGRSRAESVSSNGSKVGEAAAQLKTRLAYAMAKVQHGWEHRNITEVEQLAAALPARVAASPPAPSAPIDLVSPRAKQRRSGSGIVSWSLPSTVQGLAAAVEMAESQDKINRRRPSASSPRTKAPSTPRSRQQPLRSTTQTQQAEQDAINGLMLMGGSPGRGGKRHSLSQPSSSSQQVQQSQQSDSQQSQNSSGQQSPTRPHVTVSTSPQRPTTLSRNNSSNSGVSVAASEVREARERLLDDEEETA